MKILRKALSNSYYDHDQEEGSLAQMYMNNVYAESSRIKKERSAKVVVNREWEEEDTNSLVVILPTKTRSSKVQTFMNKEYQVKIEEKAMGIQQRSA